MSKLMILGASDIIEVTGNINLYTCRLNSNPGQITAYILEYPLHNIVAISVPHQALDTPRVIFRSITKQKSIADYMLIYGNREIITLIAEDVPAPDALKIAKLRLLLE
jgi:hypothetical protein